MTWHVRPPRAGDGTAAARIIRAWADETPWIREFVDNDAKSMAAWWENIFGRLPTTTWIAEDETGVLGFCLREDDNIGGLYVAAQVQRRGIGRGLLDRAKADRDWITVWAYAKNIDARRFYVREGLVEICCEPEEDTGLMNIEHRWLRASPNGGWLGPSLGQ